MVRLVLTWVNSPWAFELRAGLNKLGRNPTNDFRIADPSVSAFHAEISVSPGSLIVRDLSSTNGTFINGQKIEEAELPPNSTLRLGNVELRLEEVTVIDKVATAKGVDTGKAREGAQVEVKHVCVYHTEIQGAYACENCGGFFCSECVKVVGHDRLGTMTLCPVCNGQCNQLPASKAAPSREPILRRLTQTLKLPFAR